MDNITHSLAGLLLAGAVVQFGARYRTDPPRTGAMPQSVPETTRSFARTAALVGVIGANLPDLDVPWGMLLRALGVYDDILVLLHHRGRTHTLLACVVAIPLLWGLALLLRRWRVRSDAALRISPGESTREAHALLLLATLAVCSHLLLDFTNDYGVHLLSPFSNQWSYGDAIFIIEPWLWIAAVPPLLRTAISRGTRILLGLVLLLGLALSWLVPQVSTAAAIGVSAGAALAVLLVCALPVRWAACCGIGAWVAVTACFAAGTGTVRANVIAAMRTRGAIADAVPVAAPARGAIADTVPPYASERMQLMDVVTGANPANPFCSRVITVEADASRYRLTTAWASAVPQLVSAHWCSRAAHADTMRGAQHLPMTRLRTPMTRAIVWTWTWTAPRTPLATLARKHCQVAAWLQFARVPFVLPAGPDSLLVGDLRYDRDARVSVARFTLPRTPAQCPASDVPWSRPRADIWPM
ncbi:MAG: metal-dependent hydrolase [Gemmatimonadaceae bacterium]|nr:metal-dependent hydrolase [Gemmatimonadaceae bacterium]